MPVATLALNAPNLIAVQTTDIPGASPEGGGVTQTTPPHVTGVWSTDGFHPPAEGPFTDELFDGDDDTYAELWGESGNAGTFGDYVAVDGFQAWPTADIDPIPPSDEVTRMYVRVRLSCNLFTSLPSGQFIFRIGDGLFDDSVEAGSVFFPAIIDDADRAWYTSTDLDASSSGYPLPDLYELLIGGHIIFVSQVGSLPGLGAPVYSVFKVYEAVLTVEYGTTVCLQNAERSSCVQIKHPDGTWGVIRLVGAP